MASSAYRHILNFHGVGAPSRPLDPGEDEVWLDRDGFEAILDELRPDDAFALTFDDGNASDAEIALPALLRRGLRAEFFVLTGKLGRPGYLDHDGLRSLERAGMGIGSHGVHHRPWRDLDDEALEREVVDSRQALEEALGRPVRHAACPFGGYSRRVLAALRHAGYTRVYTSDRLPARPHGWLQARTTIRSGEDARSVRRLLDASPHHPDVLVRRLRSLVKRLR